MQPKELFNSIQKKYLGEMAKESGTASAVPERVETKLNSIQKKYLGTQTTTLFPAAPAAPELPDPGAPAGGSPEKAAKMPTLPYEAPAQPGNAPELSDTLFRTETRRDPFSAFRGKEAKAAPERFSLPADRLFRDPEPTYASLGTGTGPSAHSTSPRLYSAALEGGELRRKRPVAGRKLEEYYDGMDYEPMTGNWNVNDDEGTEIKRTWFSDGDRKVWANMDTLQGVGILPDGTVVANVPNDRFAKPLFYAIRARDTGQITESQADSRIRKIARDYANSKDFENESEREAFFNSNYERFSNRTLDYYRIPDITDRLNEIMDEAVEEMWENIDLIDSLRIWDSEESRKTIIASYLIDFVNNGNLYDIKEWDEFQAHSLFIFDGEVISRDATGNILYGYLGASIGFMEKTLLEGAWANQTLTNLKNNSYEFSDDPRDTERIREGFDIWNSRHPNK